MTQTQMTAHLADKIGITKRQAKSALDELNDLVSRQLKKEGLLRLAGPSRPGEFHPEPLTEPDVSLSTYPARATHRKLPPSAETNRVHPASS